MYRQVIFRFLKSQKWTVIQTKHTIFLGVPGQDRLFFIEAFMLARWFTLKTVHFRSYFSDDDDYEEYYDEIAKTKYGANEM